MPSPRMRLAVRTETGLGEEIRGKPEGITAIAIMLIIAGETDVAAIITVGTKDDGTKDSDRMRGLLAALITSGLPIIAGDIRIEWQSTGRDTARWGSDLPS